MPPILGCRNLAIVSQGGFRLFAVATTFLSSIQLLSHCTSPMISELLRGARLVFSPKDSSTKILSSSQQPGASRVFRSNRTSSLEPVPFPRLSMPHPPIHKDVNALRAPRRVKLSRHIQCTVQPGAQTAADPSAAWAPVASTGPFKTRSETQSTTLLL
ncbi:hypothetical protein PMIN02_007083 [Paraphaeosphaeria minitans]